MKVRNLFVIAGLLTGSVLFTSCYQHNYYDTHPDPNNNNSGSNYQSSFDEEFNGTDLYSWSFTDAADSAYASITGGSYQYVDYSMAKSSMTVVPTGINTSGNFAVRTSIKSNNIMGLIFGASSTDNGYAFFIDSTGSYSLYKEGIGTVASTIVIPATIDTPLVAKKGWNQLEVDQTNGTWTGFINGTQVFTMAARSITGGNFGFKILPGTVGYADYLKVNND